MGASARPRFSHPRCTHLTHLLQITNLANASSLVYNSLLAYKEHFGDGERAVNWCGASLFNPSLVQWYAEAHDAPGFYLHASLFPAPKLSTPSTAPSQPDALLLGPFCGKPACQFINVAPGRARGVCADAFVRRATVLVPDVDAYPGHIACDGATRSEVVCALVLRRAPADGGDVPLGVLDLDCLAPGGFAEEDRAGLERIAELVVQACDW